MGRLVGSRLNADTLAHAHGPPVCLVHVVFGPSTQDQVGRLMGHLFEDTLATYHPPGIL